MKVGRNVSKWIRELRSGNSQQQHMAATRLTHLNEHYFRDRQVSLPERAEIFEQIQPLHDHEDSDVRHAVVSLIGLMRYCSSPVIKVLTNGLRDTSVEVQTSSVWAIGNIGPEAGSTLDVLIPLRHHYSREVRWRLPWAIQQIGTKNEAIINTLIALTDDQDRLARMAAFDALATIIDSPDSRIVKATKRGLNDKDESVSDAACRLIQKTNGDWSSLRKPLYKMFQNSPVASLEVILALCTQWDEMIIDPKINQWLTENQGYWWAQNFLDQHGENKKTKMSRTPFWRKW